MAKAASKAMVVLSEPKKAGKGKKFCPHCDKLIGAANSTCPECGKPIKKKKGKKKAAAKSEFPYGANIKPKGGFVASAWEVHPLIAAENLIKSAGSLSEARATLDRLAAIAKMC
jgi:hypothetical protein